MIKQFFFLRIKGHIIFSTLFILKVFSGSHSTDKISQQKQHQTQLKTFSKTTLKSQPFPHDPTVV